MVIIINRSLYPLSQPLSWLSWHEFCSSVVFSNLNPGQRKMKPITMMKIHVQEVNRNHFGLHKPTATRP